MCVIKNLARSGVKRRTAPSRSNYLEISYEHVNFLFYFIFEVKFAHKKSKNVRIISICTFTSLRRSLRKNSRIFLLLLEMVSKLSRLENKVTLLIKVSISIQIYINYVVVKIYVAYKLYNSELFEMKEESNKMLSINHRQSSPVSKFKTK